MRLYTQKTHISSAQILAGATPVDLTPTPPASQFIIPLSVTLKCNAGTPYSTVTSNCYIDCDSNNMIAFNPSYVTGGVGSITVPLSFDPNSTGLLVANKPLRLNIADNMTGGNGTLDIVVTYITTSI